MDRGSVLNISENSMSSFSLSPSSPILLISQTHLFRKSEEKNNLFSIHTSLHRVYLMCLWRKSARYRSSLRRRYVIKIASRNFNVFAFFFFSAEFQVHYATDFYLLNNIMQVWQHSFSETRFVAFLCLGHWM